MSEVKAVCGGFIVGEGLEMNGKVLSATGGGSEDFVVNFSYDRLADVCTCDKEYSEILNALNENKNIICWIDFRGDMMKTIGNFAVIHMGGSIISIQVNSVFYMMGSAIFTGIAYSTTGFVVTNKEIELKS